MVNKILEAENGHEKENVVTVDRSFDDSFIEGMSQGVEFAALIASGLQASHYFPLWT